MKTTICIALFINTLATFGQTDIGRFNFSNYGTKEGLPQTDVMSIYQDRTGYIWFGTYSGAARYDSRNMQVFSIVDGMVSNLIFDIAQDGENDRKYYFVTANGVSVLENDTIYTLFQDVPFKAVYVDSRNRKWFYGENNAAILTADGGIIDLEEIFGSKIGQIFSIAEHVPSASLYLATDTGLIHLTKDHGSIMLNSSTEIDHIFIDNADYFWVSVNSRLYRFPMTETGIRLEFSDYYAYRYLEYPVKKMVQAKDGAIWGITSRFAFSMESFSRPPAIYDRSNGLAGALLHSLICDYENNIWIGMVGGAQKLGDKSIRQIITHDTDGYVATVFEDKRGRVWFAMENTVYYIENNRIVKFSEQLFPEKSQYQSIYVTRLNDDNILLLYPSGLGVVDVNTLRPVYTRKFTPGEAFEHIDCAIVSARNEVYISDAYNGKLYYMRDFRSPVQKLQSGDDFSAGYMFGQHNGRVLAPNYSGMSELDAGVAKHILKHDLPAWSVFADGDSLWIGTENGLALFCSDSLHFIYDQCVNAITTGREPQYMWLGTNEGVIHFNKSNRQFDISFCDKMGLQHNEITIGGMTTDRYGQLWIGTFQGLAVFDCHSMQKYFTAPRTDLLFTQNGVKVNAINQSDLRAYKHTLQIEMISLSFVYEADNIFEYALLDGTGDVAYTVTRDANVHFANLPPGNYTFKFRSRGYYDLWSDYETVSFVVARPYWMKWWFFVVCLAVVAAFVRIATIWRTKMLKQRNLQLVEIIAENSVLMKKLAAEKERFQSVSDNLPNGVLYQFYFDTQTNKKNFSYLSSGKLDELLGVKAADLLDDKADIFALVHPDDIELLHKSIEHSAITLTDHEVVFRYGSKNSWLQIVARPRRDGHLIIWDGILMEITQRKNMELEIDEGKNRLKILSDSMLDSFAARENEWMRALDNMDDGALFRSVRDLDTGLFCFDYVSNTWEKIIGVSAKDTLLNSQNIFNNIPEKDLVALRQSIYDSDTDKRKFTAIVRYIHPVSKSTCWLQISSYTRHIDNKVISNGFIFDVTALHSAEQKLHIEQSRLKALNDMPDGTLFRTARKHNDKILMFDYVSATWEKLVGVSPAQTLADARSVFMHVVPEDLKLLMQKIEESYEPMEKFEVDVRYIHPVTKVERWLNIWSYPRRDDEYTYSDGFIFDVTERKKDEVELAKYRENLEFLVQERTDELVVSTEELKSANEELHAITEELYTTNEVLDKTLSDNRYQLVVLDLLVEASGIGLWDMKVVKDDPINPNNIFLCSDEFRRILGYTSEKDFPNKLSSWSDKLHPEDKDRALEAFKNHITDRSGQTPYDLEYRLLRKDGIYGYYRAFGSTVRDEDGTALRVAGALSDITEKTIIDMELEQYRTQLEQMIEKRTAELTRAMEKARESDHLKSAFLANMSHEIRTPLHGIVGLIQFFETDLTLTQRKEYIKIINNSSSHLMRLIDEIIDVSKIEAKQMTISPASTHLNEMMNELRINFETYLQTMNKQNITLLLDDSQFIDPCLIIVDPFRLRQVLDNLLSNAVKFTEKGYIRFGYRQSSPDMLEFFVEDTGIGLPAEQHEVIFERFRQAELGHNRQYGGFGLGLNISRSLVQLMGGDMCVESLKGDGATFYFTIPYAVG